MQPTRLVLLEADDVLSQVLWRAVRAKVLARRGERESPERLAREAVALATDFLDHRGTVHLGLAEVLRLAESANAR